MSLPAQVRLRQRNIPSEIIDIVLEWGFPVPNSLDRVILDRESARQIPISKPLRLRIEKHLSIVSVTDGIEQVEGLGGAAGAPHTLTVLPPLQISSRIEISDDAIRI